MGLVNIRFAFQSLSISGWKLFYRWERKKERENERKEKMKDDIGQGEIWTMCHQTWTRPKICSLVIMMTWNDLQSFKFDCHLLNFNVNGKCINVIKKVMFSCSQFRHWCPFTILHCQFALIFLMFCEHIREYYSTRTACLLNKWVIYSAVLAAVSPLEWSYCRMCMLCCNNRVW